MMRRAVLLVLVGFLAMAASSAAEKGRLQVDLQAGAFRWVDEGNQTRIEMEGFNYLKRPGRPMLPEKQVLILLPPGARFRSLQLQDGPAESMPNRYAIPPAPPLLPLVASADSSDAVARRLARWEQTRRAAYADDQPYPAQVVRVVGSGTLRQYSYVRLAFSPFAYRPVSGRLSLYESVSVSIEYALPEPKSEQARWTQASLSDSVAEERAAELFVNFDDLNKLYEPQSLAETSESGDFAPDDYVIITTSDNAGAVAASGFPGWKSSLGFNVRVVLTTDPEIAGQPGDDLAQRIRNFLRANYLPWGIEFVLLVGDVDDVPMRYCYPDPENHLHDPWDPGTGPGSVPTDAYYADLSYPDSESWDLDGDGFHGEYTQDIPDFMADISVGRIPTSLATRITYTLDKLVRVEQDTGDWKRQALHAGAVLFYENQNGSEVPFRDGAVCVDEIEKSFMQGWTVSRYSEQEGLVPSLFPWPALTLSSFISDWNNGTYGIVNWAGHGWPDGVYRTIWRWDDGDGIPETDGSDGMESDAFIRDWPLLQDDYPSIVCAVSCDVACPEPNGSGGNLGVHLLTDSGLGAASGVVASTRYAAVSRDWPAIPGGAESLCYEFNRHLIAGPGGYKPLGTALLDSKFFTHINYGWENDYEFRNFYNYNLYGDPSMDWRGVGNRSARLLRNTEITQLSPADPPVGSLLPLDPGEDLYVAEFAPGSVDPDPAAGCPLVFYEIDAPVWLWLTKSPSGEVLIDF